jgi:hypothetical protein
VSKIKENNRRKISNEIIICYNCGFKISEEKLKYCPNCSGILDPNAYINWKKSWYGFLCCLCIIPLLIALLIIFIF